MDDEPRAGFPPEHEAILSIYQEDKIFKEYHSLAQTNPALMLALIGRKTDGNEVGLIRHKMTPRNQAHPPPHWWNASTGLKIFALVIAIVIPLVAVCLKEFIGG